ncbi:MAG TPA: hypothetical protein VFR38_10675 [Gaiellaceae bacterium]|nr:hypothetical protein [Gaiellaceae bacterium]
MLKKKAQLRQVPGAAHAENPENREVVLVDSAGLAPPLTPFRQRRGEPGF